MTNIVIPAIKEEFKVPSTATPWKIQSINTVKKVKALYGNVLEEASKYIGIPYELVVGFTSVESGGLKNENLNGSAKGIMQVEVGTAWNVLSDQLKVSTLGNFYIYYKLAPNLFIIKKTIPTPLGNASNEKASDYLKIKSLSSASPWVSKYLTTKDAKFSAYIGALVLGQMINKTLKTVGQIRLDHIIIKYNAGTGAFARNITKKGLEKSTVDTTGIYNSIKTNFAQRKAEILRAYILKMLGINGVLDVQKQKLA